MAENENYAKSGPTKEKSFVSPYATLRSVIGLKKRLSKKMPFRILTLCFGFILVLTPVQGVRGETVSQDIEVQTDFLKPLEPSATALTHYTMGVVYDMYGLTENSIDEFKKAATFDKDNYLIYLKLGADYARLGMMEKAIDTLGAVSKLNPKDVQSHYLLALIYSTQKEFDRAAQEYEVILKSFSKADPENIEVYGYLGQLYYSQKKYPEAIRQFEKILTLDSKNAEVMYLLGSLYLETKDKQKAIDLFKKSIEIDPEHDGSLNSLGYLYAEDGNRLDEASSLLERAIKIDPDNGAYLDSLGWLYYKKGMYDEALKYLQKADTALKDPVIYDHLGDVYLKLNQADKAKKSWQSSLEMQPNQDQVLKKLDSLSHLPTP